MSTCSQMFIPARQGAGGGQPVIHRNEWSMMLRLRAHTKTMMGGTNEL